MCKTEVTKVGLAPIFNLRNLKILDLSKTQIRSGVLGRCYCCVSTLSSSLSFLVRGLPNTKELTHLYLGFTAVSDRIVPYLQDLPLLQCLKLTGCTKFSDRGLNLSPPPPSSKKDKCLPLISMLPRIACVVSRQFPEPN